MVCKVFIKLKFMFKGKEGLADKCRLAFAERSRSDHIMLIKAFKVFLCI
jgi:hypothetical protein